MDFDFEDSYANRIRTVDDILDNPILQTEFDYISKAVRSLHPEYLKIKKQLDGGEGDWLIETELGKKLREFKPDHEGVWKSVIKLLLSADMPFSSYFGDFPIDLRFDLIRALGQAHTSPVSLNEICETASVCGNIAMQALKLQSNSTALPEYPSEAPNWMEYSVEYHNANDALERIIHESQNQGLKNSIPFVTLSRGDIKLVVHGKAALLRFQSKWYSLTWDELLCWRSVALFRRNCGVLLVTDPTLPRELLTSLPQLFQWQEACISVYQNQGYELAKATESVFKARMMQISDKSTLPDSYSLMIAKQKEKEKGISQTEEHPMVSELESFSSSVDDFREAAELFGALKFSGHPRLDPKVASKSAREFGCKKESASLGNILEMRSYFCDMILRGYIQKHGSWPRLEFHSSRAQSLRDLRDRNIFDFTSSDYRIGSWNWTSFHPFMEFDYHADYLEMIEDKSLGLDADVAWAAWTSLKKQRPDLARVADEKSKKLMIRILSMDKFDPKAIFEYMRTVDLTSLDLCMALYPKEKEFKLEARLFVMLELVVRVYMTLAEKNFKLLMKEYIPTQSMTKGRKGTMQSLERLSKGSSGSGKLSFFIEIDLTRWNLNWRGSTVEPVSRVVDSIFGLAGAFSRGHQIFENSTVVVRIADETPPGITPGSMPSTWPESDYVWRNHRGGFEGIIQGQWTACTQAAIHATLAPMGLNKYELLGQGDNQILAIEVDSEDCTSEWEQVAKWSGKITQALEIKFYNLNQVVKPDECLYSQTVITYSKLIWRNGVQYPTTLKHAATVSPSGTSVLPSASLALASVSSGCRASADSFSNPGYAYYYYLALFCDALTRHITHSPSSAEVGHRIKSSTAVQAAILVPADLGGLPTQSPHDFLLGGSSDRLSASTSFLFALSKVCPWALHWLGFLGSDEPWRKNPNLQALLEDPFSIPLRSVIGADVKVDTAIKKVLPSRTKNQHILQITDSLAAEFDDELSQFLIGCEPLYPLLMADVRELSIVGVKKRILKKFTGTRTIQQLTRGSAPINYRDVVFFSDIQRIDRFCDFFMRSKECRFQVGTESVWDLVEQFRRRWDPNRKILGLTTLHPSVSSWDIGGQIESENYIEFLIRSDISTVLTEVGPFNGRWGDKTWEHRKHPGVEVIGENRSVLAAKRILLLESQLNASGTLQQTLRTVLKQRTPANDHILKVMMPTVIGGVAAHRWDSSVEEKAFAWLGPITLTQHVSVQTDSMTKLSGGAVDYAFAFQEHILYGLQMIRTYLEAGGQASLFRAHYDIQDDYQIPNLPICAPPIPVLPIRDLNLHPNPLVSSGEILFQSVSDEMPSSIAPVRDLPETGSPSILRQMAVHLILDQMENPALIRVLKDDIETPSGLSFDVGSLAGAGMESLVYAAGVAGFLKACELVLHQKRYADKSRFGYFVDRLAALSALPLARYAGHPDVRRQPWVRKNGVYFQPGKFGGRVIVSRISMLIRQVSLSLWNRRDPSAWGFILSSHARQATPSRVLGCVLAAILLWGQRSPETNAEEYRRLFMFQMFGLRFAATENQRVAHHLKVLHQFSICEGIDEYTRTICKRLLEGRVLSRARMGVDDSIRYMRTGSVPTQQVRGTVVQDSHRLIQVSRESLPIVTGVIDLQFYPRLKTSAECRARYLIQRALGYSLGASTISRVAAPIIAGAQRSIQNGSVLLVGVGLGAMARDILRLGPRRLDGVDLKKDLPLLPSLGTAYVPPEIPTIDPPLPWRWRPEVFSLGGDWFDERVTKSILQTPYDLIVLDIQGDERPILADLDPILKSGRKTTVLKRWICDDQEFSKILDVLAGTCTKVGACTSPYNPEERWTMTVFSGAKEWKRAQSVTRDYPLTYQFPSLVGDDIWYPDQKESLLLQLFKGRMPTNQTLSQFKAYLCTSIAKEERDDPKWRSDISLSLLIVDFVERLPVLSSADEVSEKLLQFLYGHRLCQVGDIILSDIKEQELRSLVTRVLPRLFQLTDNGWKFLGGGKE